MASAEGVPIDGRLWTIPCRRGPAMGAGRVVVERDGDRLRVVHADPVTHITDELLGEIRAGNHHPDVRLDGDVLTIDAVNQKVVYRLGEHELQGLWTHAEWPD